MLIDAGESQRSKKTWALVSVKLTDGRVFWTLEPERREDDYECAWLELVHELNKESPTSDDRSGTCGILGVHSLMPIKLHRNHWTVTELLRVVHSSDADDAKNAGPLLVIPLDDSRPGRTVVEVGEDLSGFFKAGTANKTIRVYIAVQAKSSAGYRWLIPNQFGRVPAPKGVIVLDILYPSEGAPSVFEPARGGGAAGRDLESELQYNSARATLPPFLRCTLHKLDEYDCEVGQVLDSTTVTDTFDADLQAFWLA